MNLSKRRTSTATATRRCRGPGRSASWRRSSRARLLTWFLGTVRRDGRPHAAGVGALWHDGELYITSGPGTQKITKPCREPGASVGPTGRDRPCLRGLGDRVTDDETLERIASIYRKGDGRSRSRATPSRLPLAPPAPGHRPGTSIELDYEDRIRRGKRRTERRDPLALHGLSASQGNPAVGRVSRLGRWSRHSDLNRGPAVYETAALPLSYVGARPRIAHAPRNQLWDSGSETRTGERHMRHSAW